MVQTTIDSFFINQPNKYFILEWSCRFRPENCYFSNNIPSSFNYKHSFLVKSIHRPITLYGNIGEYNIDIKSEIKYNNIHFLKSLLQKAIRRKNSQIAVCAARHLLDINEIAFLRRLSIIIVEDCIINNHYITIIWLLIMVSSKILSLKINHKEWLLGFVYYLSECNIYDNRYNFTNVCKYKYKELDENDLILSLEIRKNYGGMKGDMEMIRKVIYIIKDEKYDFPYFLTIKYNTIDLEYNEWILEAIDYHCFPKIIEWIDDKEKTPEEIKEIIWIQRSSINYKKPIIKNIKKIIFDNEINKKCNLIAKYVIKNYS